MPPTIKEPNRPTCSVRSAPNAVPGAALVLPACNTEATQLHLDAWHQGPGSKQHLARAAAATRARTQRPRKYLVIHAAELCRTDFQILRRHRRSLLLRPEHAYRSAVENHVHRAPRLSSRRVTQFGITCCGPGSVARFARTLRRIHERVQSDRWSRRGVRESVFSMGGMLRQTRSKFPCRRALFRLFGISGSRTDHSSSLRSNRMTHLRLR